MATHYTDFSGDDAPEGWGDYGSDQPPWRIADGSLSSSIEAELFAPTGGWFPFMWAGEPLAFPLPDDGAGHMVRFVASNSVPRVEVDGELVPVLPYGRRSCTSSG